MDCNNDIGHIIKTINDRLKARADAIMKQHDLTLSQERVLAYMMSEGGSVTQKNIEDHLKVTHPTVVGIVARLEKNGFVHCYLDPENRRNKIVELSERAYQIADEMKATIRLHEEMMLKGLSVEEVEALRSALLHIADNIK